MPVESTSEKLTLLEQTAFSSPQTGIEKKLSAAPSASRIEKGNFPIQSPVISGKRSLDLLFWFKWIAIALIGFAILKSLSHSLYDNKIIEFIPLLFAVLMGALSLVQWLAFRDQLGSWWLAANIVGGILLGGVNNYFYYEGGWWGKDVLFNILAVANFVLGAMLLRRAQAKPKEILPGLSAKGDSLFVEADPRRSIFFVLLTLFLVLDALVSLTNALSKMDVWYPSSWLKDTTWILYGILSILAGVSFFLVKAVPRVFGFVTLAIFLIMNGLIVELFAFNSDSSEFLFNLPGTMALLSVVFFGSQRQTWKHFRFIMLSCYLFSGGLLYFGIDVFYDIQVFTILSGIFALLTAIFFFLRK